MNTPPPPRPTIPLEKLTAEDIERFLTDTFRRVLGYCPCRDEKPE